MLAFKNDHLNKSYSISPFRVCKQKPLSIRRCTALWLCCVAFHRSIKILLARYLLLYFYYTFPIRTKQNSFSMSIVPSLEIVPIPNLAFCISSHSLSSFAERVSFVPVFSFSLSLASFCRWIVYCCYEDLLCFCC